MPMLFRSFSTRPTQKWLLFPFLLHVQVFDINGKDIWSHSSSAFPSLMLSTGDSLLGERCELEVVTEVIAAVLQQES